MRRAWEVRQAMIVGSEWTIHNSAGTALWRVSKIQSDGFLMLGPLGEDRTDWQLVKHRWPLHRQLQGNDSPTGFTIKDDRGRVAVWEKEE